MAQTGKQEGESLGASALAGAAWMSAARFLKLLVNALVIAVLARLLTPADFGLLAVPLAIVALGVLLADGSFAMVLVQKKDLDRSEIGASILLCSAAGGLFAAAIALAAPAIELGLRMPGLAAVLQVIVWVLPLSAMTAVGNSLLQRRRKFRNVYLANVASAAVYGATAIAFAAAGWGAWALVIGSVANALAEALLVFLPAVRVDRPAFTRGGLASIWRSGGLFTLSNFFSWGAANSDRFVLARLLGASDLGLYVRGMGLVMLVNGLIGTGAFRVLFATFSRLQDDRPRLGAAFERALSAGLVVSGMAGAFMILHAEPVVLLFLGPQWTGAIAIVQVAFVGLIARSGYTMAEAVPLSLALAGSNAVRQAIRMALIAGGAWIGGGYGIVGAAVGVTAALWLFYLLSLAVVHRLTGLGLGALLAIHLRVAALAAVPVAAALALRYAGGWDGALGMILSLAGFGAAALLVGAFAPADAIGPDLGRMRARVRDRLARMVGIAGR